MPDPAIATAADYADAMITARRAKNVLSLLLLLVIVAQLAIFFIARFSDVVFPREATVATQPAEGELAVYEASGPAGVRNDHWYDYLHYVVGFANFTGIAFAIVLAMVLLLIVAIMLVGRLIGVARTTSAYIWALLLVVLLFPWQAILADETFRSRDFIVPGVLYTWDELLALAQFPPDASAEAILGWARFVLWPVVALILLLVIHVKSNRGLRQALGEDYVAEEPAPRV